MGDDLKALPPLEEQPYKDLAAAFRSAADTLWEQNEQRKGHVVAAVTQWTGATQEAYITRFEQGFQDGAEICGALYQAAAQVDGDISSVPAAFKDGFAKLAQTTNVGEMNLLAAARRENQRREAARLWLERREHYRNNDSVWDSFNDFIGNDPDWESIPEIGPMPDKVEEPFLQAPPANIEA
jgi:hypothetical protein